MPLTWEEAQDRWAREQVLKHARPAIETDFEIVDIEFGESGSYQMSEYTWDYEDPNVTITYTTFSPVRRQPRSREITVYVTFKSLVADIVALGQDESHVT